MRQFVKDALLYIALGILGLIEKIAKW